MGRPFGSPFQHDRPNPAPVQLGSQPHAHRAAADHDHIVRTQFLFLHAERLCSRRRTCLVVLSPFRKSATRARWAIREPIHAQYTARLYAQTARDACAAAAGA
jgi:hypothetical protein